MRYVSFRDVVVAMGEHAPYNWCKWALKGALFDGLLWAYAQSGKVKSFAHAAELKSGKSRHEQGRADRWDLDPKELEAEYDITLPNFSNMEWDERVGIFEWEWSNPEDPWGMAPGYHLWGDTDWVNSSLLLNDFQVESGWKDFFSGDQVFEDGPDPRLHYDIEIHGLCFELNQVSAFAPNLNLDEIVSTSTTTIGRRNGNAGRPRKWDWTGALVEVIKVANTPDGLPSGQGAQAKIERLMAEWFVKTTKSQPASSQIRSHAQRIMAMLGRK